MRARFTRSSIVLVAVLLSMGAASRLLSEEPKGKGEPAFVPFEKQWTAGTPVSNSAAGSAISPAVVGDKVVFCDGKSGHQVYCVDAASGKPLWTYKTDDNGPSSVIATEEGFHLTTNSCTIETINPTTGVLVWKKWIGSVIEAAPCAAGDKLLVVGDNPDATGKTWGEPYALMCLKANNGDVVWTQSLKKQAIGAPCASQGSAFVATQDGDVFCNDMATGKLKWRQDAHAVSAPFIADKSVYVTCAHGDEDTLARFDVASGRTTGTFRPNQAGNRKIGQRISAETRRNAHQAMVENHQYSDLAARPVVQGGVVYSPSSEGLYCLDEKTLKPRWKFICAKDGVWLSGSPRPTGERVYVVDSEGTIHCLDARTGKSVGKTSGGTVVSGPPAIVDGRLYYVTGDGVIHCQSAFNATDDGWPMLGGTAGNTASTVTERVIATPSAVGEKK